MLRALHVGLLIHRLYGFFCGTVLCSLRSCPPEGRLFSQVGLNNITSLFYIPVAAPAHHPQK